MNVALLKAVCSADHPAVADQGPSAVVPAVVEGHLPGDGVRPALVAADNLIIEAEGGCAGTNGDGVKQTKVRI